MFSTPSKTNKLIFSVNFKLSPANAFNFDESKNLSYGTEFNSLIKFLKLCKRNFEI